MSNIWKVWWPEDGETEEDSSEIEHIDFGNIVTYDFETVAHKAAKYDYDERDGWERRLDSPFAIMVKAPSGETRKIMAVQHADVGFNTYEDD